MSTISLVGKSFDLLAFDLDGVLVSTSPCHENAYQALWRQIGLAGPKYATIAGRSTIDVIREFTISLNPTERQLRAWTRFKQQCAREMILSAAACFPDTLPTLETLAAQGISLALGTSASRESTQFILDRFALRSYFSLIVIAGGDIRAKPYPDVYTKIISDSQASSDSTLIIEDSAAGLQAAMAANAYAISVRTGLIVPNARFLGAFADLSVLCDSGADRS